MPVSPLVHTTALPFFVWSEAGAEMSALVDARAGVSLQRASSEADVDTEADANAEVSAGGVVRSVEVNTSSRETTFRWSDSEGREREESGWDERLRS
jgi:hypothetical protein